MKLPPDHLFSCTVGRQRSQARCVVHNQHTRCACVQRLCTAGSAFPLSNGNKHCGGWALPCALLMYRGFLNSSAEVGTLLAKLANRAV